MAPIHSTLLFSSSPPIINHTVRVRLRSRRHPSKGREADQRREAEAEHGVPRGHAHPRGGLHLHLLCRHGHLLQVRAATLDGQEFAVVSVGLDCCGMMLLVRLLGACRPPASVLTSKATPHLSASSSSFCLSLLPPPK